jgi:hypothetical protein
MTPGRAADLGYPLKFFRNSQGDGEVGRKIFKKSPCLPASLFNFPPERCCKMRGFLRRQIGRLQESVPEVIAGACWPAVRGRFERALPTGADRLARAAATQATSQRLAELGEFVFVHGN